MGHLIGKERGRQIHTGELIVIPMKVDGTLSAGNDACRYKAVHSGFVVKELFAYLGTLHTTSTGGSGETIQLRNVTDTVDLTTAGFKITDTEANGHHVSDTVITAANAYIAKDEILAIDVDAVDSGGSAADLIVYVVAERVVT